MKLTLSVLMIAAGIVRASGDAVSCSVIDYLYYSSDCCDGSNSVQCMESIPQTDKAVIDNLASLKRPEGAACESGDSIKFLNSKIVCTTADSCLIPCVNGNITGSVSGNITGSVSTTCACACNAGFSGADCSTADPTTPAPAATTTTTTPAPAATTTTTLAPAPTIELISTGVGWDINTANLIGTAAGCEAIMSEAKAEVRKLAGYENYEFESGYTTTLSDSALDSPAYPKGCVVRLAGDGQVMNNRMYFNINANGGTPSTSKQAVVSL